MLTIIPTPAEVLCWLAEETGLEAQGLVWGFTAMQEGEMVGYIVVEEGDPARIIALEALTPQTADELLKKALRPRYEEGIEGYTFICNPKMPLPMVYTRKGIGSMKILFNGK